MWLRRVNGDRGSVAVLIFAAVPILTALLLLIVDMGRISLTRARLQVATDRAAYAAASSLAYSMNELAAADWELHKAYRDLRGQFEADSEQSEDSARGRIDEYESRRDEALSEMETAISDMGGRALSHAESTLLKNSDVTTLDMTFGGEPALETRNAVIDYAYMEGGGGAMDPEKQEEDSYEALSHMVKERSPGTTIGVFATAEVSPLMLGAIAADPIEVYAASVAQAFGGSLEDFALKDTDSVEEAETLELEDDYDALYRSSLVPVWTVNEGEQAIFH
jgi:hypothetical protein